MKALTVNSKELEESGFNLSPKYWVKRKEEEMRRKCKNCGNPIPENTRSDKIFCSKKCVKAYWDNLNREYKRNQDREYKRMIRARAKELKNS